MNAQAIIALVVQFAQLAFSITNQLGLTSSQADLSGYADIALKLQELIEKAKAALSGDDLAELEAQLELIHPDVLALSATLDAELAKAELQG